MNMDLYPAIDLRGGRVVQLQQGDYGRETHYDDDPVAVARGFEAAGARWIHVVDLDAARSAVPRRTSAAIEAICRGASTSKIETGGGVRDVGRGRSAPRARRRARRRRHRGGRAS